MDRMTGLQVFARVASLGSLSGAARAMGMSQTMATKHVAALETRLGVKLLHRTTRRLTLTDAGRRFLESTERILADLAEAEALASADRLEVRGTLRINAPISFGIREIAPLIATFAERFPAVKVDLGLNDRRVDLVEEGWDVAVRIGQLENSTLVARKVAPCRLVVCASPRYLAAHGRPERVAELSRHNCLVYTLSRAMDAGCWTFGRNGDVVVPVTGNLEASGGDALLVAALAGQGLIYQPTFLVGNALRAGELVALPLDHPTATILNVFLVYPANRNPPAKVRAFVDLVAQAFGPVPSWDRDLDLP